MEVKNGSKEWYKNGLLHRDNDLPAIIQANGLKKMVSKWKTSSIGICTLDNDLPVIIYIPMEVRCGIKMEKDTDNK